MRSIIAASLMIFKNISNVSNVYNLFLPSIALVQEYTVFVQEYTHFLSILDCRYQPTFRFELA